MLLQDAPLGETPQRESSPVTGFTLIEVPAAAAAAENGSEYATTAHTNAHARRNSRARIPEL
jgi:hypothetical protein